MSKKQEKLGYEKKKYFKEYNERKKKVKNWLNQPVEGRHIGSLHGNRSYGIENE